MDRITFFKNFNMGIEIDIAGNFLYNGIMNFNKLKDFNNGSEIFHVLYPISVGIERLQKVLLVLHEDIDYSKIEEFEKSLITHSHQELQNRIKSKCNINFNSLQNSFLELLTRFYNSCRYCRFSLADSYRREKDYLVEFMRTKFNVEIITDNFFCSTRNCAAIKERFGRVVGSLAKKYYNAIYKKATELSIYTYELRYNSAASKVFQYELRKDSLQQLYNNEQIALKEVLIFLLNTKKKSKTLDFIRNIKPLSFDIGLIQDYIADICEGNITSELLEELESLYCDVDNIKERLMCVSVLGDSSIYIDDDGEIEL